MAPFLHCKKAEILNPETNSAIQASVSTGAIGGLLVSVPRETELSLRGPVHIRFYDPVLGVVRCRCRLFSPLASGNMRVYRCKVLEQLARVQRREDVKVSMSVMVNVDYEGMLYPSTIENISAGGVYLVSGLVASVGEQLTFVFPRTDPPATLTADILRAELRVNQNGRNTYGYGCRFVNLNVSQESLLRGYVFQEEKRSYRQQ